MPPHNKCDALTELVDIGASVLKKRLKPNTSYFRNGYEYATDAFGRIKKAAGELRLDKASRDNYVQRVVGKKDGRAPQGTPELADVIDEADPQQLGRLRVRYHWPVDNPQQAETDWLRLLTPYSGDGKGQLFKPEVGSQVLVDYQNGLAEQPFVLGNLFHAHNQQGAKYSPAQNSMKGLQTAGGNKVVMQDTKGKQTILISNSNNKGTAVQVSFQGDGSITIKSNGPISLTAGGTLRSPPKRILS